MTGAGPFPNIGRDALVMPKGPQPRTVGARLRAAREKRGVSLRQIADSTRISVMSLEALERSDLSRLPGGIFTRAFVRAYAEEVGLDPDRTIEDFIAELPPDEASATAHSASVEDGEKLDSDRKAAVTAIRLILVSLPIIGLVVYYGTIRPSALPDAQTPAGVALPAPASVAVAVGAAAEPQSGDFTLEIAPRASCLETAISGARRTSRLAWGWE